VYPTLICVLYLFMSENALLASVSGPANVEDNDLVKYSCST
jgi:hypothetical protein